MKNCSVYQTKCENTVWSSGRSIEICRYTEWNTPFQISKNVCFLFAFLLCYVLYSFFLKLHFLASSTLSSLRPWLEKKCDFFFFKNDWCGDVTPLQSNTVQRKRRTTHSKSFMKHHLDWNSICYFTQETDNTVYMVWLDNVNKSFILIVNWVLTGCTQDVLVHL